MHIQLLEVRAKRDDAHASGFKVSLTYARFIAEYANYS